MRDVSRLVGVVVAARGHREPVAQPSQLHEPEADGQEQAGPQEGDDLEGDHLLADGDAEAVDVELDGPDQLLEGFHGFAPIPPPAERRGPAASGLSAGRQYIEAPGRPAA